MTEIKDCLPQHAVPHFISLRNLRLETEQRKFQEKLVASRQEAAARGVMKSGGQQNAEWKLKEEFHETISIGYIEDALETCKLYDIKITRPLCDCLIRALQELLVIQYKHALQAHAQGIAEVKIPLSVRARMGNSPRFPQILNRVQVMLERARVEDEKGRLAVTKNSEGKQGDTYQQTIHHYGPGPLNASQTGNVNVQYQSTTIEQLQALGSELAQVRAALKAQNSLDADESVGLIASAQKAAEQGDESRVLGFLKQIPSKAWEVTKDVISAALMAYLKAHGFVP